MKISVDKHPAIDHAELTEDGMTVTVNIGRSQAVWSASNGPIGGRADHVRSIIVDALNGIGTQSVEIGRRPGFVASNRAAIAWCAGVAFGWLSAFLDGL